MFSLLLFAVILVAVCMQIGPAQNNADTCMHRYITFVTQNSEWYALILAASVSLALDRVASTDWSEYMSAITSFLILGVAAIAVRPNLLLPNFRPRCRRCDKNL